MSQGAIEVGLGVWRDNMVYNSLGEPDVVERVADLASLGYKQREFDQIVYIAGGKVIFFKVTKTPSGEVKQQISERSARRILGG